MVGTVDFDTQDLMKYNALTMGTLPSLNKRAFISPYLAPTVASMKLTFINGIRHDSYGSKRS